MAFVQLQSMDMTPRWNYGGSVAYLYVFASQSFFEATSGEFIGQGQPSNLQSFCQKYTCTVTGTTVNLPLVTLATTTDSTIPNTTYTVIITDSSNVTRFTLLSQGFVDPSYFSIPALSSVLVTLGGTTIINGIYSARGYVDGAPYYNLLTFSDSTSSRVIRKDASTPVTTNNFGIYDASDNLKYLSDPDASIPTYPWQHIYTNDPGDGCDGDSPSPIVEEYPNILSSTWEQLILSNQGFGTPGALFQWNAPFWDVAQTKQYVATVVTAAGGTVPYANALVAGKTQLDVAPLVSTVPIAVGTNSPILTALAPKASPTFTGTVTVTGNITATTTIHAGGNIDSSANIIATGTVTGSNLSGTNTGNVTKSGENYISLTGQAITVNAVNLSGTNVTGTLATARMPALTGDVTTSAGAVATTIANDAVTTAKILNANVTNAKVATGIDAAKLADGTVSNTKFQYINSLSSNAQTQLTALGTDKANLASPTFTGVPAAPTAAPLTNTTQLATCAFVTAAVVATPLPYLASYLASTITYNANASLSNTALSITVASAGEYLIELNVYSTSAAQPLNMDFAGTATFTNFIGTWTGYSLPIDIASPTSGTGAKITAPGTDFSGSATGDMVYAFKGSCLVNAGGSFLLRGCQLSSNASNTTIVLGSTLTAIKLN